MSDGHTEIGAHDSPCWEQEIIELYRGHAAGLCRYAAAIVKDRQQAEDLVHEAFLRFMAERTLGCSIASPKAWIYRVLRNLALDRLRRVQRSNEIPLGQMSEDLMPSPSPHESMECRQTVDSVVRALSGRELECLRFRSDGLRYEEIAAVLGLRVGTVGTLLARAYKKTREVLDRPRRVSAGPAHAAQGGLKRHNGLIAPHA